MAGLSNEIYISHTDASGDIAVGIGEVIDYKNIKLVGYNSYNYHEYISQSLVNLADDIAILQGGPVAAAAAALDDVVAAAKTVIDTKVNNINTALEASIDYKIKATIATLSDQYGAKKVGTTPGTGVLGEVETLSGATTEARLDIDRIDTKVQSLDLTLNGSKTDTAIIGLVKKVQNDAENISDLLLKQGAVTANGVPGTGILGDIENLNKNAATIDTINSSLNTLKDKVGTTYNSKSTTISGDLNDIALLLFKNKLNTISQSYTGVGIYDEIYNSTTGILAQLSKLETLNSNLNEVTLSANSNATSLSTMSTAIENIENNIGSDTNVASILGKIKTAATKIASLETTVGQNTESIGGVNSGLTKEVNTLKTSVGTASSGLIKDVNTLKTSVGNASSGLRKEVDELNTFKGSFDTNVNTLITTAYTDSGVVYNVSKLKTIDSSLTSLLNQFDSYFKVSGMYITAETIGKTNLDNWIANTSTTGFKKSVNEVIRSYLDNDAQYLKIASLETTVGNHTSTINGHTSTISGYNTTLNDHTGKLNTLLSDKTVDNSIENRIDDALIAFKTSNIDSLINTNIAQTNSINLINTEINNSNAGIKKRITDLETFKTNTDKNIEEIKNESINYSVLLPFLKKVLVLTKDPAKSSTDIITLFDNLINNVNSISNDYSNNGTVTYNTTTNTLNYTIASSNIDTIYVPELNKDYFIRLRFINKTVDNYEYVAYFEEDLPDPAPAVITTPLSGNKVIDGTIIFYKLIRSSTINTQDVTDIQSITTFDSLRTTMININSNDMELFLDIAINPALSLPTYSTELISFESFKVKFI